ncbi:MAG: heavy-metal-associated domain-containing protein [Anaerolineaceae bacterium]|nr:heavy-metal-associated domain-containing protein [Anaerolineaceae bacterium]
MATITYHVPNINCNHCVHTIKTELSELHGVKSVDAVLDTKKVTITYDAPATTDQFVDLLNEISYPPEN